MRRYLPVGNMVLWSASVAALCLFALPLVVLAVRGVGSRGWEGASAEAVQNAVLLSLFTTAITLGLTLLFGTPLAYLLARRRFILRRAVLILIQMPIIMPPSVAGLALLITFGRRGALGGILSELGISLPFTTAAVIIAQTFVAAPFYIRAAMVGFQGVPHELEAAARVDGADGLTLFRLITLPLAMRGLGAGATLCWTRALGEFGATILFAGSLSGRTQTMPLLIYGIFERDLNAALWVSLILAAIAFFSLSAASLLMREERHDAELTV
jgi:molybdate transport system permease protein